MVRLLFYSDTADYGGHEAMTLEAVQDLANDREFSVAFAFCRKNHRLGQKLAKIKSSANLEIYPLEICSRSLQNFRTLLCPWEVNGIKTLMGRITPDVVLVSQGRIESCSAGLLAAKRAGLRTISYIPMAHEVSISGKPVAVRLRESVNRYLYRLPDKFITISESSRSMLRARGVRSKVVVVPNGIEQRTIRESERNAFRTALGFCANDYVVAMIGRIEFRQKRQDFVIRTLPALPAKLADCKFLFIGGGPDAVRLRRMVSTLNLGARATILPWSDNQTEIYAGIDMLLIPSRFEGVPLVMLEAMSCGLPIVASNVDGMAELLPEAWLFPSGNADAMLETIVRVKNSDSTSIAESNKQRILTDFSVKQFCLNFREAVLNDT